MQTRGAEALPGLARAFIYAQARTLLVSHWGVNSDATVKLITGAMSRLAANKSMGRAEAMRQSMLALIDKGEPQDAHPALWAPFVVVGEGGALGDDLLPLWVGLGRIDTGISSRRRLRAIP